MAQKNSIITKSIDVGSMFLMDLSVHDSETNDSVLSDTTLAPIENGLTFTSGLQQLKCNNMMEPSTFTTNSSVSSSTSSSTTNTHQLLINDNRQSVYMTPNTALSIADHRRDNPEFFGDSFDRLASAIKDCDSQQQEEQRYTKNAHHYLDHGFSSASVTIAEPQTSSSLSDESYVANSAASICANLNSDGSISDEPENEDKGSATTREDSGVLDMKDLDGQLNNSYDDEDDEEINCHHDQRLEERKNPISQNIKETNLINDKKTHKAVKHRHNYDHQQNNYRYYSRQSKPTDGSSSNNNYYHNYPVDNSQSSRRKISASLPIQVPARQLKKDLKQMKLNLIIQGGLENESDLTAATNAASSGNKHSANGSYHQNRGSIIVPENDDVDEFLEQEYNDNHHNHYPINEHDEEPLRADENPMKLFASIQALARSLHEDAEIFGSLPPKRLLESPVRSLALV